MKTNLAITAIFILLIAAFGGLGFRLYYLQYYKTAEYELDSKRQQRAIVSNKPPRGIIVDRQNKILAASKMVDTVFAEPRIFADPDAMKVAAAKLQDILQVPSHEICAIIEETKNPGFVKIKDDITTTQRKKIKDARIYGIGIHSNWRRSYPMGSLTSNILGLTDNELKGIEGIELKYNSYLTGQKGRDIFVVDAHRNPIALDEASNEYKEGNSLISTIDSTIQQFTRQALIKQCKAFEAESAIAIVMDPWTGAILSMVSVPDFDPVDRANSKADTRRNRAITDPYEPGSIFKPIVAAIALDEGVITKTTSIYCEKGNYTGKGFGTIGEWGNHRFGNLNVNDILVRSSNIGMAKIGQKAGKNKIHRGVKLFGFGSKTGIDLPGEDSGILRNVSKWDGYSITRVPFGHEVSVTAIQIIRAYATLANGGSPVTPHIISAIVNSRGQITEFKRPSRLTGKIIDPKVAEWIVQKPLVGVVNDEHGTGRAASLEKWQVFGKTGTANISSTGGNYDEQNYVASFAGGAPAEDPAVVILVSIRKPNKSLKKGYSGGKVAAPVVKEILEKTMTYLEQI